MPLHFLWTHNIHCGVVANTTSADNSTTQGLVLSEAASEQTRFRSVINLWAFNESAHIDNWIVYSYFIIVLRYHWLVYFDLISFYFLVFYLEHYSFQYYSYCEFYIVFTMIFNVLLPVCFMYHYLVPLFICMYVYLFIHLYIESQGLATFLVLMLFVLQCTDYKSNFLTLFLLLLTLSSLAKCSTHAFNLSSLMSESSTAS